MRATIYPRRSLFAAVISCCFVTTTIAFLPSLSTTSTIRSHKSHVVGSSKPKESYNHRERRYPHQRSRHDNGSATKKKRQRLTLRKSPEAIEDEISRALKQLRDAVQTQNITKIEAMKAAMFPSVRQCNAALAAFGDGGELLKALRIFGKMRKATILQNILLNRFNTYWPVPSPTLVTYSTLMSRAARARKPLVALRLWNLMGPDIVPDLKAANILMNCYAKLADVGKAQNLLQQMNSGNGYLVPRISPNIVTYNTLLHACQRAGKLDEALSAKADLDKSGILSDARTYTSLIATVARKPSRASGKNDPSLAFSLLEEMQNRNIRPNGMTYSALIDACGRCRRSDLALQGLRTMLRQKATEEKAIRAPQGRYALDNEVGAWTAAINACGKAGRLETARRLFYVAMPSFGCKPNTVTCGCMIDMFLRAGRTAETLAILRYMKNNRISPSEVMYTSLMTHTERLVEIENKAMYRSDIEEDEQVLLDESGDTRAIAVYTELMEFLMERKGYNKLESSDTNTELLRVFLIFQQMKAAGASPDIACYNALLRACARSGDISRAREVIDQILDEGLAPNDISWRELLKCAAKLKRSDLAEEIWLQALSQGSNRRLIGEAKRPWKPSVESFSTLLSAYVAQASSTIDSAIRLSIFRKVFSLYNDVLLADHTMGMDRIDIDSLLSDIRAMVVILVVSVALAELSEEATEQRDCRTTAAAIQSLEVFKTVNSNRLSSSGRLALQKARQWSKTVSS